MNCVLVSATLDMRMFLPAFAAEAPHIKVHLHGETPDPAAIDFALAWHPPAGALAQYPNLRMIGSIAAGVDNILADPALPADVPVVRMVDPQQADLMTGFVLWHILYHQRRFDLLLAQQRERVWQRQPQRAAGELPVGILGLGRIGATVARNLARLGYPVHGWSRTPKPRPAEGVEVHAGSQGLERMLPQTEVLICLLPLTGETRGLLNAVLFARLRPGSYLIHVGRGPQLVERDLLDALDSGVLSGASLDVFGTEPLPRDHPFWSHPRILVTPHTASDVSETTVIRQVVAEAGRAMQGLPLENEVDRRAGY